MGLVFFFVRKQKNKRASNTPVEKDGYSWPSILDRKHRSTELDARSTPAELMDRNEPAELVA